MSSDQQLSERSENETTRGKEKIKDGKDEERE